MYYYELMSVHTHSQGKGGPKKKGGSAMLLIMMKKMRKQTLHARSHTCCHKP